MWVGVHALFSPDILQAGGVKGLSQLQEFLLMPQYVVFRPEIMDGRGREHWSGACSQASRRVC